MEKSQNDFSASTSVSSSGTQEENTVSKKKTWKSTQKKVRALKLTNSSSGDADVSAVDNERDLTPGSLEIWVDLPDEIKFDASLAPFKQLYEQHHGKLESETQSEGDRHIFARKTTELDTIGEVDSSDARTRHSPPAPADRLINGPDNEDTEQESTRKKRISRLLHSAKLALLVACWLLLTVALLLNSETSEVMLHTAVRPGITKVYALEPTSGQIKVLVKLTGPFQQNVDLRGNNSEHGMLRVWLQRSRNSVLHEESSTYWGVPLQPDSVIDFSRSETVSKALKLPNDGKFMSTSRTSSENETISKGTAEGAVGNDTEYLGGSDIDEVDSENHQKGVQKVRDVSDMGNIAEDLSQKKYQGRSISTAVPDKSDDEQRDYFEKKINEFGFEDAVRKSKYADQNWNRNELNEVTVLDVPDEVASESTNRNVSRDTQETEVVLQKRPENNASNDLNRTDSRINSTAPVRIKRENIFNNESKDNLHLSVTIKDASNVASFKNSNTQIAEKETLKLCMNTTSNATVPVTLMHKINPLEEDGVVYATVLLCVLYVLIIFEVVNRTVAALLSSSLGIAVLALGGSRPSLGELVSWLDVETLLLLFSMMLLVAILAETGLFDYLAVVAFEVTGGRTWPLINCLCLFTAVFSTFLDNVTTVLLMTPVTIRLCEVMQLNPVPVLMSMVVFSNVGGAATPVGDPPNVIIASHPAVVAEGINFATFTLHMGLGILLVAVQTYLQLRFMFRDIKKLRHNVPHDIQELRQEIAVWRRAAASLSSYSRDEDLVRKALEKKVEKLQKTLTRRELGGGSKTDPKFCSTLAQMKQKYRIRDKQLLIKSAICVTFVVVVFFLHCIPELQRLSLGWTALLGALLLLLLADHDDLEPILARVEWSTLLFFAALFVLMEALSKLGLIMWIGNITEMIIRSVGEGSRLAVALMLVLWISGIASAFVDNIPLTTMMVRVIAALGAPDGLALPLAPLAWALSFGACLGGNGTLIGASANVVCAGVAEQHGYRFTFVQFFKVGFPIMIGHLIVASVYLLICHCAFTWH